ncbi:hypothetical protein ES707_10074 [subsurface metagenome]
MKTEAEIRKMTEDHWAYTEMIILDMLKLTEDLYKTGMIHGYKHRIEDAKNE